MDNIADGGLLDGVIIRNTFVRQRNVLLSEADFSPLYVDYYLHCRDHGLRLPEGLDGRFKELLAAFTLHCASRPRNEVMAWTVRFTHPLSSFFFAGDTELGTVVGRAFTENIREMGGNELYQDLKRPGKDLRRSFVDFEGNDACSAVERFYAQSEQRPGKLYFTGDDRAILVTAHPDFDEAWFDQLNEAAVAELASHEELNLLETRTYRWMCGCSHAKILEILAAPFKENPYELFGAEESIQVNCPRCAGRYRITRESLEAHVSMGG